ncbi:MAG: phage tail tube protein [Bacillota bacterium]
MPGASSVTGYIGMAKQALKGTAVAPSKFIKFLSAPKMAPVQDVSREPEGGSGRDDSLAVKIKHKHDGSFSCYARPDIAGFLLAMALGADSVAGAGPYDHTIVPADTLPWLTVEMQRQLVERIGDCKIESVDIEGESGKPIKLAVTFLGTKTHIEAAPTATAYETEAPFVFTGAVFTINTVASTLIEKFKISIKNGLDGDIFTNAITRNDIVEHHRQVDVEFTAKFESADDYKKVYYGGIAGVDPASSVFEGALIIAATYGAGAGARGLTITIPVLKYVSGPIDDLDPAGKTLNQEFVGFATKGTDPIITVAVKNNTTLGYFA